MKLLIGLFCTLGLLISAWYGYHPATGAPTLYKEVALQLDAGGRAPGKQVVSIRQSDGSFQMVPTDSAGAAHVYLPVDRPTVIQAAWRTEGTCYQYAGRVTVDKMRAAPVVIRAVARTCG